MIKLSLALFTLGIAADIAQQKFGWAIPPDLIHLAVLLAGITAIGMYCTKLISTQITATAFEFRRATVEEHRALYRSLLDDIEEYGKRREIAGHLINERRHITTERAGETTTELPGSGDRRTNKVTPLLRKHG